MAHQADANVCTLGYLLRQRYEQLCREDGKKGLRFGPEHWRRVAKNLLDQRGSPSVIEYLELLGYEDAS